MTEHASGMGSHSRPSRVDIHLCETSRDAADVNNAERSLIIAALVIMGLALAFFTLTWRGTQLGPELNSWPKLTAVLAFSYREDLAVYEARIRSQRGPYRGQE